MGESCSFAVAAPPPGLDPFRSLTIARRALRRSHHDEAAAVPSAETPLSVAAAAAWLVAAAAPDDSWGEGAIRPRARFPLLMTKRKKHDCWIVAASCRVCIRPYKALKVLKSLRSPFIAYKALKGSAQGFPRLPPQATEKAVKIYKAFVGFRRRG